MTADDDLGRAWAEYTLRFADPDDPTRHSETRIRDAFAAGWDAALAGRSEPRAEGLREALQAIIDLRVVVPDHPHGGVHPPYLEWVKVAEIVHAALAARSEPRCEMCARGDRDTHAQHMARSEPRAEGLREGDWLCPTCGTLFRFQPAATPPAEGLDVERLARAITASGFYALGGTDSQIAETIAEQYAALAPEQPDEEDYEAAMDLIARTDRPE